MTPGFAKTRAELSWLPYGECNRVIINAHRFGGSWTPAQISTTLWLDGADASTLYDATSGGSLVAADGGIARWQDKSGNARHVTQATSGNRPLRKTLIQNGRDVVRFDGTNDLLESTFTAYGTSWCVLVVAKQTNSATVTAMFIACTSKSSGSPLNPMFSNNGGVFYAECRDNAGNNPYGQIASPANNTWTLYGGTRSSSVLTVYKDGTAGTQVSATAGTTTTTVTTVGARYPGTTSPSGFLNGDIAEIVVCSSSDRVITEGYLAHKWGLAANLPSGHTYKSAAP